MWCCLGCPHQEAVSVMTDQVMLLHSQLLFERNQCLQHATRNRRLLSMMHKSGADKEDLLTMVRRWLVLELHVNLLFCVEGSSTYNGANSREQRHQYRDTEREIKVL